MKYIGFIFRILFGLPVFIILLYISFNAYEKGVYLIFAILIATCNLTIVIIFPGILKKSIDFMICIRDQIILFDSKSNTGRIVNINRVVNTFYVIEKNTYYITVSFSIIIIALIYIYGNISTYEYLAFIKHYCGKIIILCIMVLHMKKIRLLLIPKNNYYFTSNICISGVILKDIYQYIKIILLYLTLLTYLICAPMLLLVIVSYIFN